MQKLALLTLCSLAIAALPAQKDVAKNAKRTSDPYTKGEEQIMKRAGYVALDRFMWAEGHSTDDIRKMMPTEPMVFVETEHFKIGSSLPTFKMPKSSKRKKALLKELKELKKRIPTVNARARKLDPWLRLHLFAMRLENHYDAFQELMGVTDKDFAPREASDGKKNPMGQGPYLGLRNKFMILMLRKASNQGRYSIKVTGKQHPVDQGFPHYFVKTGCFLMVINTEIRLCDLHKDREMHCFTIFSASQHMVAGYRGFMYNIPVWLSQGIVHWFCHALDPEIQAFQPMVDGKPVERYEANWHRNVRGMVKNGSCRPLAELLKLEHSTALDFLDIMSSWSRVEFMIKKHKGKFREFFHRMNDVLKAEPNKPPAFTSVLANQDKLFKEVWKMTPDEFDAAWKKYVLKNYPRR